VFKGLFAEVGEKLGDDAIYVLDYDGDFGLRRDVAWISGTQPGYESLKEDLSDVTWSTTNLDDACAILRKAVLKAMDPDGSRSAEGELPELSFEAALLDRNPSRERRFRFVVSEEV
jgi:20S proteasome alpha/beta subunit